MKIDQSVKVDIVKGLEIEESNSIQTELNQISEALELFVPEKQIIIPKMQC